MKHKLLKYLPLVIVVGVVITGLLTSQMEWRFLDDCSHPNTMKSDNVQRIDCATMEYGFPFRYLSTEPKASITYTEPSTSAPLIIGFSSAVKLNWVTLLLNVLLWSIVASMPLIILNKSKKKDNSNLL